MQRESHLLYLQGTEYIRAPWAFVDFDVKCVWFGFFDIDLFFFLSSVSIPVPEVDVKAEDKRLSSGILLVLSSKLANET